MELRVFVKETLLQIAGGIAGAQKEGSNLRASFNPSGYQKQMDHLFFNHHLPAYPQDIAFDVAVTVRDSASAEGGAGILVAVLGVAGKAGTESQTEAISRVRFTVPVQLPTQPPVGPHTETPTMIPMS